MVCTLGDEDLVPTERYSTDRCKICFEGLLIHDGGDVVCTACGAVDEEEKLYMQQEEWQDQHSLSESIWSITSSGKGTAPLTRLEKEQLGLHTGAYRYYISRPREEKTIKIIGRICDRNNLALPLNLVKESIYWATKIMNELASKREKDRILIKISPAEISLFSIRKACKTSCLYSCSMRELIEAHRKLGYCNIEDKKILHNLRRISFVSGIKYETFAPGDYVSNLTNCLIGDEEVRSRLTNVANPLDYIGRRIYKRSLEVLEDVRGDGRNNIIIGAAAVCIADRIEGEVLGSHIIAKALYLDKYKLSRAIELILAQMERAGKELKFRTNHAAKYRSEISAGFARFRQRTARKACKDFIDRKVDKI